MILKKIRTSKCTKVFSVFILMSFFNSIFQLNSIFAISSGVKAPEFQLFTPIGVTDMVDSFTGNFGYNIPLFEVPGPNGGYPLNLSYQSDIGMDQDASWVGLGWTLHTGSIERQVRGIPDDSNGKIIHKTLDIEPSLTTGGILGFNYESFGADQSKSGLKFSTQIKVFFNNKRGWGVGSGGNLTFLPKEKAKLQFSPGVGINSDSQNGSSISLDVSLANNAKKTKDTYTCGLSLSSASGIGYSLSYHRAVPYNKTDKTNSKYSKPKEVGEASLSFAYSSYTPALPYEYKGIGYSLNMQFGVENAAQYKAIVIQGFYISQEIKEKIQNIPSFGYLYLGEGVKKDKRILDYDREKEGMLGGKSSNLGIPNIKHDIYSITGQGISAMFRAYRTDIGILSDPTIKYTIHNTELGGDAGWGITIDPPPSPPIPRPNFNKWGVNSEYSGTINKQSPWNPDDNASILNTLTFKENSKDSPFPLYYYKVHGEYTTYPHDNNAYIRNEAPLYIPFVNKDGKLSNMFKDNTNKTYTSVSNDFHKMETNTVITPFFNKELQNNLIGVYGMKYTDDKVVTSGFSNTVTNTIIDDIGGYSVTQQNGSRYIYALPVYNLVEEEVVMSIDNSKVNIEKGTVEIEYNTTDNKPKYEYGDVEKYYEYTRNPAHASSFLLTAVLGPDYVDVDGNGPSKNDLGYWVKFEYTKNETNYPWRAPFNDALFLPGTEAFESDNKGAFTYGIREQYYLKSIETRTHKAVFELDNRIDGYGAKPIGGKTENTISKRLKVIHLYTQQELELNSANPTPIKSVHFCHTYTLCNGTLNSTQGKLTLDKLFFTYGKSNRGEQSPYIFKYGLLTNNTPSNPTYKPENIDRWGNVKLLNFTNGNDKTDQKNSKIFPYTLQSASQANLTQQEFEANAKAEATSWQLTDIFLPSGGQIKVEYEKDDYAYVQHQQAQQVFFLDESRSNLHPKSWDHNSSSNNSENLKVYFKLKHPIPKSGASLVKLYEDYVAPIERNGEFNMYFKVKSKILPTTDDSKNLFEYISGYAELETNSNNTAICGFDESKLSIDGKSYLYGFVQLKPIKICKMDNKKIGCKHPKYYHPFAVAAWQHMRLTMTHIVQSGVKDISSFSKKKKKDKIKFLTAVTQMLPSIADFLHDYTNQMYSKGYANRIEPKESFIRLAVPDGKKNGGGSRVAKISITDNWQSITAQTNEVQNATYGQIYSYETSENGKTISSGVAAFEPMVGGDENALKFPKKYTGAIKFNSDNNLYFEYPINESQYPAPTVGYSKVTVHSFATHEMKNNAISIQNAIPAVGDGYTVFEYYTAREFPVISYETNLDNADAKKIQNPPNVIVPFIGYSGIDKLSLSQGYTTILNNMHGKMKSLTHYTQNADGGIGDIINKIEYTYKADKITYQGKDCKKLNNVMDKNSLLKKDMNITDLAQSYNPQYESVDMIMGEEYDFAIEANHRQVTNHSEGLNYNTDNFILSVINLPLLWPSFTFEKDELNTIVTNKIIHRTGILLSTTTIDKNLTVQTLTNKVFDANTGRVLLTETKTGRVLKNSNNDKISQVFYDYSIPAYMQNSYPTMGRAAVNQNCMFQISTVNISGTNNTYTYNLPSQYAHISPIVGDEYLVLNENGNYVTHAYLRSYNQTTSRISFITQQGLPANTNLYLKNIRSGNRNLLESHAGSIRALDNPLENENRYLLSENEIICSEENNVYIYQEIADVINSVFFENKGPNIADVASSLNKGNNKICEDNNSGLMNYINSFLNFNDQEYTHPRKNDRGNINEEIYIRIDNTEEYYVYHFQNQYCTQEDSYYKYSILCPSVPSVSMKFYDWNQVSINIKIAKKYFNCNNQVQTMNYTFELPYGFIKWDNNRKEFKEVRMVQLSSYVTAEMLKNYNPILLKIPDFNGKCGNSTELKILSDIPKYNPSLKSIKKEQIQIPNTLQASSATYARAIGEGTQVDPRQPFSNQEILSKCSSTISSADLQKYLVWQSHSQYGYNDTRKSSLLTFDTAYQIPKVVTGNPAISPTDGVYNTFKYFIWDQTETLYNDIQKWIPSEIITKYNTQGLPSESVNALNVYSCVQYHPFSNQPILAVQNAKIGEVAFIDFEGATLYEGPGTKYTTSAHTGKKAIIIGCPGPTHNTGVSIPLNIKNNASGKYIISFWAKGSDVKFIGFLQPENSNSYQFANYLEINTQNLWKQYSFIVDIPKVTSSLKLHIATSYPSQELTIDDIRIHPYNAAMQTYVYDPGTYRLTAMFDENNYPTLYYYNEEGNVNIIKKETEQGIKTIQENSMQRSTINKNK